jgi:hypothetical protein
MRTPEDPTRDPASEARDDWEQLCQPLTDEERRENARKIESLSVPDRFALMFSHASEPRATPETDALSPSQGRIRTMREYIDELEAHARCLERQRDELMEMLESFLGRARMGEVNKGMFVRIEELEGLSAAIAAVKGVNG